jgi:hypothetical protein
MDRLDYAKFLMFALPWRLGSLVHMRIAGIRNMRMEVNGCWRRGNGWREGIGCWSFDDDSRCLLSTATWRVVAAVDETLPYDALGLSVWSR